MKDVKIREIALIPVESRTDRDKEIYQIYANARDCVTGSMVELYKSLEMENSEFYSRLDTDMEFREAILQGLSDARASRLLELESALIRLALGTRLTENKDGVDMNGKKVTVTTVKELAPNLAALTVLLERYKGSAWGVSKNVDQNTDAVLREVDYSMFSKAQLKQMAESEE